MERKISAREVATLRATCWCSLSEDHKYKYLELESLGNRASGAQYVLCSAVRDYFRLIGRTNGQGK